MDKHVIKIFITLVFMLFVTTICYAQYNVPEVQIAFKSTSTMSMSGSRYASTPVINEHGMAIYGNSHNMNNGVVRQRKNNSPGTPGGDGFQQPIGDIPAIAFICFICFYLLSKKNKQMVDD